MSGASQSQLGPGSGRPGAWASSWASGIEISSPETNCHNRDLMQMSPGVSVGKERLWQKIGDPLGRGSAAGKIFVRGV